MQLLEHLGDPAARARLAAITAQLPETQVRPAGTSSMAGRR